MPVKMATNLNPHRRFFLSHTVRVSGRVSRRGYQLSALKIVDIYYKGEIKGWIWDLKQKEKRYEGFLYTRSVVIITAAYEIKINIHV